MTRYSDYDCLSGRIDLICGPMFSGKSTELIRLVRRFSIAEKRCLVIKWADDQRYSVTGVATHTGEQLEANLACKDLEGAAQVVGMYDVVAIDEGQFFPGLADFCERTANMGKHVIVAALSGKWSREPFPEVAKLMSMCEDVTMLKAVCKRCKNRDAAFSARLTESNSDVEIGGTESYVAVCRKCFHSVSRSGTEKLSAKATNPITDGLTHMDAQAVEQ
ncbi:thymidine kinase [Kipferlia bialata]|uniref:Thymidine kinase n=1 Tax=Kipferlia bialata TaxID=797122 RepID=A0A391NPR1_9EUKA|nr:thymidine kinase [Kipferlia bialata]|eukprot:g10737.t1